MGKSKLITVGPKERVIDTRTHGVYAIGSEYSLTINELEDLRRVMIAAAMDSDALAETVSAERLPVHREMVAVMEMYQRDRQRRYAISEWIEEEIEAMKRNAGEIEAGCDKEGQ
jgi:RecB family exonuclease